MLRVAAYTGGYSVPSGRFRVRQYVHILKSMGVDLKEYVARLGTYPPRSRAIRPFWAVATLAVRLPDLVGASTAQVTLLQRGLLSKYVTLEAWTRRPRVLDVDDAIWLPGCEAYARGLSRMCDHVICGNEVLAERFAKWHERVTVIPTPVDTALFVPAAGDPDVLRIGWSGTSSGLPYLESIQESLAGVLARFPHAVLRVISDRPPRLTGLPADRIEFVPWRVQDEVSALQGLSVGVMPLDDSEWAQGKCSFKMLTYMACGVPVVVSPIGMNATVLGQGPVGFAAKTAEQWTEALCGLLADADLRRACGNAGRRVVEEHYALEKLAPKLATVLRSVADLG